MELQLLDHKKLPTKLVVNFACDISKDDRFYIIAETGVYIIELKGKPFNSFPSLSTRNDFFKATDYLPCENLDIDLNAFLLNLSRTELYETVCRLELSSNLETLFGSLNSAIVSTVTKAEWSPVGLVEGEKCALAVLTNTYSLEIYVKNVNESEVTEYQCVVNVTKEIIEYVKPSWSCANKLTATLRLKELEKRAESVSASVCCWSSMFSQDDKQFCCLFVGHLNGFITAVRIGKINKYKIEKPFIQVIGRFQTNLSRITALHWLQTKSLGGELTIGDVHGKVHVLKVEGLNKENIVFDDEQPVWQETDNIAVDKILVYEHENNTFLIIVKGAFVIINAINDSGLIFDRKAVHVAHFYVTGVYYFGNGELQVLSFTGLFKRLKVIVRYNKIHVEEKIAHVPVDFVRQRTHGFVASANNVLYGFVTTSCRNRDIAKKSFHVNLYVFYNTEVDPFKYLWEKSESLKNCWDCFEALRLISFKEKKFPWSSLETNLNYDKLNLHQLKILRVISKISETVYNSIPFVEEYKIKPYVILHYLVDIKLAIHRINKLLTLRNNGQQLSKFQMQSIDVQNMFLKEMVVQDVLAKANVGVNFIDEIYKIIILANELKYPGMPQCHWCGQRPTCVPPHADSRCSISMMPIYMVPGYKCPFCKSLVHKEMENELEDLFCVYCDVPLEKRFVSVENANDIDVNMEHNTESENVTSDCFGDCLQEDSIEEVVGDGCSDIVLLSDSEDGDSDLRVVYDNMQKLGLTDTDE